MIDIQNLTADYPDGTRALTELSLHVEERETVAVIGANGAGKSTLLKTLVGVMMPVCGEIRINGLAVSKTSLAEIRSMAGVVFQDPDDMLFMARVYDDVAFGPKNYGFSKEETERAVTGALDALEIGHLKDRSSARLSGGEKRRVAIAAVLAMRPPVLLLDEPTSFLDPKGRRGLIRILGELPQTKLIATHDLNMALELCGRVVVLHEGKIAAQGPPGQILLDKELMERCGLELPLGF